ncbi:hypothetical protein EVAR_95664_1 [Eumeta japonica]|uniref:Uncharacterized protein n=1 Tax=Eumeta variegata TaxID=151549 RepID=A0A4C1VMB5_EUMVA|nr:hypothetical protein EVAR_95664_1 [Eumeta japonica]
MTDLLYQGYAVQSVHRLYRKDGTSVKNDKETSPESRSAQVPRPPPTRGWAAHRVLPPSPSNSQTANQNMPLRDDIKTIMSVLRVVKGAGFADFRRALTGEDRLAVILAHQDLLAKLQSLQSQKQPGATISRHWTS